MPHPEFSTRNQAPFIQALPQLLGSCWQGPLYPSGEAQWALWPKSQWGNSWWKMHISSPTRPSFVQTQQDQLAQRNERFRKEDELRAQQQSDFRDQIARETEAQRLKDQKKFNYNLELMKCVGSRESRVG
jgi:hypothetical protein